MTSRWFDFGGDAIIRTDKYIRLAADMPSQSGWVWSRIPLTATNWEIEFEFSISGKGNLHGDGFALWVAKDRAGPGPVFGSRDRFEGLGIFFDTYKNNRPGVVFPYVMGMMGDGQTTYDAANDGKANEIGGCSVWHLIMEVWQMLTILGSRTSRVHRPIESEADLLPRQVSAAAAPIQDRRNLDRLLQS